MSNHSLDLVDSPLREALAARGFVSLTPVQSGVLSAANDRDLRISSQTGSGKTVAFGLALVRTLGAPEPAAPLAGAMPPEAGGVRGFAGGPAVPPRQGRVVQALVLTPTRELAQQVARELMWLLGAAGLRVLVVTGGTSVRGDLQALSAGADVVVGTPGRLADHARSGALRTASVKAVVLDEADEMLDMGFAQDIDTVLAGVPKQRRTMLVSATFPPGVRALADRHQRDAVMVEGTPLGDANADILHVVHGVMFRERLDAMVNLLLAHPEETTLIFTRTREGAAELSRALQEAGFGTLLLTGDLDQKQRERTLAMFRAGRLRVLVATDVAARGLDVPHIAHVIHADPPADSDTYTHRSGRTGRAGRTGTSHVLLTPQARGAVLRMLRFAGAEPRFEPLPTPDSIVRAAEERLLAAIAADEGTQPDEGAQRMARDLLATVPAETLVARLLCRPIPQLPAEPRHLTPVTLAMGWDSRRPGGRDVGGRGFAGGREAPRGVYGRGAPQGDRGAYAGRGGPMGERGGPRGDGPAPRGRFGDGPSVDTRPARFRGPREEAFTRAPDAGPRAGTAGPATTPPAAAPPAASAPMASPATPAPAPVAARPEPRAEKYFAASARPRNSDAALLGPDDDDGAASAMAEPAAPRARVSTPHVADAAAVGARSFVAATEHAAQAAEARARSASAAGAGDAAGRRGGEAGADAALGRDVERSGSGADASSAAGTKKEPGAARPPTGPTPMERAAANAVGRPAPTTRVRPAPGPSAFGRESRFAAGTDAPRGRGRFADGGDTPRTPPRFSSGAEAPRGPNRFAAGAEAPRGRGRFAEPAPPTRGPQRFTDAGAPPRRFGAGATTGAAPGRPSRFADPAGGPATGRADRFGNPRVSRAPFVRFQVSWGADDGADARRVLAAMCRRGNVDRNAFGIIDVGARSTVVEIRSDVADSFERSAGKPDPRDRKVRVRRSE